MLKFFNNYPLSKLTTLQIGGPAKYLVVTKTQEQLINAIKHATNQSPSFLVIGGGSNLLIADEGIKGLVIKNEVVGIQQKGDEVIVQGGTSLQDLVNYTVKKGLANLHKLTGIPGTIGGAIFGNAGAYGSSISENLIHITCINPNSQKITILKKDGCGFGYRDSNFKKNGLIILEATFKLAPRNSEDLKKEADEIKQKRDEKYPPKIKCPGSFFKNLAISDLSDEVLKNIPREKIVYGKIPAGALLEIIGAKGDSINGIEIAPYHANLFINKGGGNAKDFYTLVKKYHQRVKEKFGITLEPEVCLINLPPLP